MMSQIPPPAYDNGESLLQAAREQHGLIKGRGGGKFEGMEQRIARLEDKVDKVHERLGEIDTSLVKVNSKVDAGFEKMTTALNVQSDALTSSIRHSSESLSAAIADQAARSSERAEKLAVKLDGTSSTLMAELKSKVEHKWAMAYIAGIAALILRDEIKALFGY